MVLRKPLPGNSSPVDNVSNAARPPRIEVWSATDSEVDTDRIWEDEMRTTAGYYQTSETESPITPQKSSVPAPLRPGAGPIDPPYTEEDPNPWHNIERTVEMPIRNGPPATLDEVPDVLRPGVKRSETNPFKRKPLKSSSNSSERSDSKQRLPEEPRTPPPPPPATAFVLPPIDGIPDRGTNPWQPVLDGGINSRDEQTPSPPSLLDQDLDKDVWGSESPSKLATMPLGPASTQSTGKAEPDMAPSHAPVAPSVTNGLLDDGNAWEGEESSTNGKQRTGAQSGVPTATVDGWNLIDHEPISEPSPGNLSRRSTWEDFGDAEEDTAKEVAVPAVSQVTTQEAVQEAAQEAPQETAQEAPQETEESPALPPRATVEVPPPQPPRRHSPSNINMSETYQIKNINWHDSKAGKNPRKSPILVQNANGPCPLVALVNALTLTTPGDQDSTNLVEALGSREQISLSLLLEVVVDELMSSRHRDSDGPLPDMSELYAFLQGLHTGMNVNPRFIPSSEAVAAHKKASQPASHPSNDDVTLPGTFENTRDMELYATFRIPLLHGWLPPADEAVYDALKTRASSYDDAQNLLFHEEELEHKFSNSLTGLTEEEQQLYQDIIVIKSFLATTATQLTSSGLDTITNFIKPGEVSILFRNDHFSTLYRHPQTLQLFTLVTDAGYYTHDEVVWESLTDVRGEQTEFFSGDFRVVGGNNSQRRAASSGAQQSSSNGAGTSGGGSWQTVHNRRSRDSRRSEPSPTATPVSPQHEQEDRDLALALQLQEEEEQRHREEQAARRRENDLSNQFIEQQGRGGDGAGSRARASSSTHRGSTNSLPPPRGSSANQSSSPRTTTTQMRGGGRPSVQQTQQQVRSLIPPRTHRPTDNAANGSDEAPPSYEQAARSTPYLPPAGHPSHPESTTSTTSPRSPSHRRSATLQSQSSTGPGGLPARTRQSAASVSSANGSGRDRDCIVM